MTEKKLDKTTEPEPETKLKPETKTEPQPPEAAHRGPYDHNWRGPYEDMATAPGAPDPGPGASLVIDTPTEGATVPPVHDITGSGARPDTEVSLAYGEGTVVATVAAAGDGGWGFTGDTPAALGPQTWTVSNEGRSTSVNVIVEEPVSEGMNRQAEGKKSRF